MGQKLYPKSVGTYNIGSIKYDRWYFYKLDSQDNYMLSIYYDDGTCYYHWLEFCMYCIIPKLKNCSSMMLKEFMLNFISNFHEGARCKHPVDWLYDIYLKQS